MDLGTLNCVRDRIRLRATQAAGESICPDGRGGRSTIVAAEIRHEAEPAVQVNRRRPIPPAQAQSRARGAGDSTDSPDARRACSRD